MVAYDWNIEFYIRPAPHKIRIVILMEDTKTVVHSPDLCIYHV